MESKGLRQDGPLRGVGKTALGVAMVRARESRRDDRLFDDPYAQAFVDAAPGAFPEEPKTGDQVAALGSAHGGVPRCERTTVPADVRENWTASLTHAGFSTTRPTAWLAEGLLLYLTADEAGHLLTGVSELSAPGSRLSFEHSPMASAALTATARQLPAMRQYTALWKGGLGDDAPGWLTGRGRQLQFDELAALAASYRRPRDQNTPRGPL